MTEQIETVRQTLDVSRDYLRFARTDAMADARARLDRALEKSIRYYTSPEAGRGWTTARVVSKTVRHRYSPVSCLVSFRLVAQVAFS